MGFHGKDDRASIELRKELKIAEEVESLIALNTARRLVRQALDGINYVHEHNHLSTEICQQMEGAMRDMLDTLRSRVAQLSKRK